MCKGDDKNGEYDIRETTQASNANAIIIIVTIITHGADRLFVCFSVTQRG
jgi:hypothetical protein